MLHDVTCTGNYILQLTQLTILRHCLFVYDEAIANETSSFADYESEETPVSAIVPANDNVIFFRMFR